MKTKLKPIVFPLLRGIRNGCTYLSMLFFIILLFNGAFVSAQLPAGFVINKLTGNTINEATSMAHSPDGRIFLAERSGAIKVYKTDGTISTVHTVATTTATEQGLLGITLHQNFASNGRCYVYYTNTAKTLHYLDMLVITPANTVSSVTRIMEFDPILNGFHNGGAMLFKNGLLYICIGESNTPAQSTLLDTYRGKVLRVQEDGTPAPGNPFYSTPGATRQQRSIWAIGMRNPWAMSLDPVSGKLYVVNVGGNYEEVDDVTSPDASKNYNYGWGAAGKSGPEQDANTITAAYYYGHPGWGCAITSGTAFNPSATNYPTQYKNRFYFTDWCSGWLRSFDINNPSAGYLEFAPTGFGSILGTSVGVDGNIYFINYNTNGSLSRLEYTIQTTPVFVNQPINQTVTAGDPVSFSVAVSGVSPFSYQWKKNEVNIPGANSSNYTIPTTATSDAGNYRCTVTNAFGNITSTIATLTVLPFNSKPVAKITSPVASVKWNVLDVINYTGTATDAEEGNLPASAYNWEVRLYHKSCPTCEHWHPGPAAPSGVTSGSFIADNGGESSSDIWVRLILTVTDATGRIGKDSVDFQPNKVIITATSNVPGLQVILGASGAVPYSKTMVVNSATTLQAITPQVLGDYTYTFTSWNHGGAAAQNIRVPAVNTTYTANYSSVYTGQAPYGGVARTIPGTIQVEDYDTGGQGVAYNDLSAGNAGNGYRLAENVDLEGCSEGGFNIGYVDAGEWTEYSVNITQSGSYTVTLRVSTPNAGRTSHLELDGVNITGVISIPTTGGWQAWQTVTIPGINLTVGSKVLRFVMDGDNFNTNYIGFALGGNQAPTAVITSPAVNASFTAPASIVINASATDADGFITKVEFFNGTVLLGTSTTAPYTFTWTGVVAGTYNLTVKATDNLGLVTTSAITPVSSVVVVGGTNLALNRPAFSRTNENAGMNAAKAVDGIVNVASRWSSAFADPQWIYVDLGAAYNINRVKITWETASGKDFEIQTTNDTLGTWSKIKEVFENSVLINDYTGLNGNGRYLRIYGTRRNTAYGYSIIELEVYGTSGTPNLAPAVSITSPSNNSSIGAPASILIAANATDADGSVSKVEFYNGVTLIGTSTAAPFSFNWTTISAGTYSLTAKATDNLGATTTSTAVSITVTAPSGRAPFGGTPRTIPGKIESEDYDLGGEGIAFHDLSVGNAGGAYRTDGVDLQGTADVGGGFNVGWVQADEWLEYTVNVATAGTYNLAVRLASPNTGRTMHVELDEVSIAGTINVPNTTGYQNWQTVTVPTIALTTGQKILRVHLDGANFNINYLNFSLLSAARTDASGGSLDMPLASTPITVYPNPVVDALTISTVFAVTSPLSISIYNATGVLIKSNGFVAEAGVFNETIDLASIPSGVYTVKVISSENVFVERIIKQ